MILRIAWVTVVASAIWLALSVTVVLWPAATLGLAVVVMALLSGAMPSPRAVLNTVRAHLTAIYAWGVVNGAILALYFALDRYEPLVESLPSGVATLLRFAARVWFVLQLYAVPLLLLQRDGRMLSAWRSAILLALAAPVITVFTGLLAALIVGAVRAWPVPLLLIAPGALALLGCAAVRGHLHSYGYPLESLASESAARERDIE